MFVIGFSKDLRPRRFTQHARFYLLPKLPFSTLRHILIFTVGTGLVLWIILTKGASVLVAQSPYEGFAGGLAKHVAQFLGRSVILIIESHGDFEGSLFRQRRVLSVRLYGWLMSRVAGFSLRQADLLRAVSRSTKGQLQAWAPGKQVVEFPAWTDLDIFLEAGKSRQDAAAKDIMFAGVLTPLKGVHFLVEAFASVAKDIPLARLWIVGRFDNGAYVKTLKAQARQLGLDGRVTFMDEVSQPILARYMARAHAFVLPSVSEGLGRVVIEAMATGTPVVGSRIGGIPELVEDGVTGFLFPPGDATALAGRLLWILTHPEEAKVMGEGLYALGTPT